MSFEFLGYPITIEFTSIIEIVIFYIIIFFLIRYIFLRNMNTQLKLLIGVVLIVVIALESLNASTNYHNIFIVKYRNIIYMALLLIFLSAFQPELRYLILKISNLTKNEVSNKNNQINILEMLKPLKEKQIGAFLVIQNSISIEPYMISYTELDSKISSEILQSIFTKTSILHDGAVIISNDRIKYAKVFFKSIDSNIQNNNLGARHRAALYLSTQTDADIYVVSEERGTISYCKNGKLSECKI